MKGKAVSEQEGGYPPVRTIGAGVKQNGGNLDDIDPPNL